jgi:hypothetical protein
MKDEIPGRVVKAYTVATPVLWLLGLLLPATILLLLYLTWRARASGLVADGVAVPWYLVAACQGLSVTVNWWQGGLPFSDLLYRLTSTPVSGWLALGLALGVGRHLRLASPPVVRAAAIQGANFLWLGAFCLVLATVFRLPSLSFQSPMAALVPESLPARAIYFVPRVYGEGDILGDVPSLVLFYPWTSVLGFAGLATFFISANEPSRPWRIVGCCGGLTALVGSQSRAAFTGFALGVVAYLLVKTARSKELRVAVVAALVCAVGLLVSEPGRQVLGAGLGVMHSLRSGSSEARLLGYEKSWEGFQESPFLGHGFQGDMVAKGVPMALGSHSSVYGLLYTGGALTFSAFCFAIASLLFNFFRRAIKTPGRSARAGFAIVVGLAVLSYGESLYSLALPLVVVFVFLGGCIASADGMGTAQRGWRLSPQSEDGRQQ